MKTPKESVESVAVIVKGDPRQRLKEEEARQIRAHVQWLNDLH